MKRLMCIAMLGLAMSGEASAQSLMSNVKVEAKVDFNRLADQLGQAVKFVLNRIDDHSDSVPELSVQLNNIAGNEEALAKTLEVYAANPDYLRYDRSDPASRARFRTLQKYVSDIQHSIVEIQSTLRRIDGTWAISNHELNSDIGGFAHDGQIQFLAPGGYVEKVTPEQALVSAKALRNEAKEIRKMSSRLAASVKQ